MNHFKLFAERNFLFCFSVQFESSPPKRSTTWHLKHLITWPLRVNYVTIHVSFNDAKSSRAAQLRYSRHIFLTETLQLLVMERNYFLCVCRSSATTVEHGRGFRPARSPRSYLGVCRGDACTVQTGPLHRQVGLKHNKNTTQGENSVEWLSVQISNIEVTCKWLDLRFLPFFLFCFFAFTSEQKFVILALDDGCKFH